MSEDLSDHASDFDDNDDSLEVLEPDKDIEVQKDDESGDAEDVNADSEEEEVEIEEDAAEDTMYDLKKVSKYNRELVVVKPENRMTSHILSKFEMTEIVSIRATQISQHNNPMCDMTGLSDPIRMAKRELMLRMCPLTCRRIIGDAKDPKTGEIVTYVEFWNPNEMLFAIDYTDV
jgi:DNA-directed RNA polymerase subunit K/omega